jgi:cation transport ATPase
MKTPFQRILPILKGVLVVCGILFLLQVVGVSFFWANPLTQGRQIQQIHTMSQQLEQINTLSQQLQHRNNHVTGVLSEEGGKGPSPTRPDADQIEVATKQMQEATRNRFQEINNEVQEARDQAAKEAREAQQDLKKRRDAAIIAVLVVLIVGLIGMAVVPYFRDDPSRGVAIKKTFHQLMVFARIIKNSLVVIVGLFFFFWTFFASKINLAPFGLFVLLALFIAGTVMLVYTLLYFFYYYCDSVYGGDGEKRGRMSAQIKKIARRIFLFCEIFVILGGVLGFPLIVLLLMGFRGLPG